MAESECQGSSPWVGRFYHGFSSDVLTLELPEGAAPTVRQWKIALKAGCFDKQEEPQSPSTSAAVDEDLESAERLGFRCEPETGTTRGLYRLPTPSIKDLSYRWVEILGTLGRSLTRMGC